jgi:hypothetical protein
LLFTKRNIIITYKKLAGFIRFESAHIMAYGGKMPIKLRPYMGVSGAPFGVEQTIETVVNAQYFVSGLVSTDEQLSSGEEPYRARVLPSEGSGRRQKTSSLSARFGERA